MKKLIYAQYCNDILKAVKKDYFIVLPESVFSLYVLATGLEKYKDKNEAIRYYYAKCNLLSYVKKPDDFKDSRERVVAELDKLSGDYKKLIEARLYMTGAIYEYDIDKAIAILNELAANGNDLAKEELAIIYFVGLKKDNEQFYKILLDLVDHYYLPAFFIYADALRLGYVFNQDNELAMIYAKKALKAGDYRAYSVLTLVEIYVNQNFKVAFEYAKKGEKYLLRWCIFELGKFYYFGNPCEVDHKKAIHCFQDAGHYGATKGYLYQAMVQLESKDKSLIKPYAAYVALERYVENGGVKNAQYYYLLGNYYISKPGKEYFKAKECFNEVAKSDDATAGMLNNIGVFYKLEMNDLKKAAEFYKMAMDKGSQSAAISYRNIVGK